MSRGDKGCKGTAIKCKEPAAPHGGRLTRKRDPPTYCTTFSSRYFPRKLPPSTATTVAMPCPATAPATTPAGRSRSSRNSRSFSGVKVSSYVQLPARAAFPTPVEIGKAVEKLWKMAAPAADCRHLPPSNAAASSRRRAAQPTHLRVRRPLPERWLPGRTCRPTLPQTPE